MIQIFFLVLLLAMILMLYVITKQEQRIIELNHKINIMELEMKGNDAIDAVTFSLNKHRPSLRQKQKVKR